MAVVFIKSMIDQQKDDYKELKLKYELLELWNEKIEKENKKLKQENKVLQEKIDKNKMVTDKEYNLIKAIREYFEGGGTNR